MASFLDDLWAQQKDNLTQTAANQLSNIGSTLITNSVNSLFKIGTKPNQVIQAPPQVVQVQAEKNDNMLYWILGGVGVLVVVFLVVRR